MQQRDANQQIYVLIAQIPEATVVTYGQLARLVGCTARQAGNAMAGLPAALKHLPWHRVVNSQGKVSCRAGERQADSVQQSLLKLEGIVLSKTGRLKLSVYQYHFDDDDDDEFLNENILQG